MLTPNTLHECMNVKQTHVRNISLNMLMVFISVVFSPFVVKYYGSYFKNTDLWVSIVTL